MTSTYPLTRTNPPHPLVQQASARPSERVLDALALWEMARTLEDRSDLPETSDLLGQILWDRSCKLEEQAVELADPMECFAAQEWEADPGTKYSVHLDRQFGREL